jgi:predicted PurR-regulated permease PerM
VALSKSRLSPWFLLALLVIVGWISLQIVGVFINYVLMGLFIAFITHPMYDWLAKRVRYTPLAAMLMVLSVTLVVLVPLAFLLIELVDELRGILRTLDVATLEAQFTEILARLLELFGQEPGEPGTGPGLLDVIIPSLNAFISRFASNLLGVIAEGIIGTFVMLYVLYYGYTDGGRFLAAIREILPLQAKQRDLLIAEVGNVVQGVLYGHVLTAIVQAVLGGIGFYIFGVPNVVFWTALMFILSLLPVIGPPVVWLPWGIYLLLSGDTFNGIGLLIYSAIMVSSLDNILRPKFIGDRAHIHPVVVLLGVLGGLVVFGFSGLILGPLVLSIFVTIVDLYRTEFVSQLEDDGEPTPT